VRGRSTPYRAWFVVVLAYASSHHAARFLFAIIGQGLDGGSPLRGAPLAVQSKQSGGLSPPRCPRALRVPSARRGSPRGLSRHGESPGDFRSARQVSPFGRTGRRRRAVTPSEVCEMTRNEVECVEQPLASCRKAVSEGGVPNDAHRIGRGADANDDRSTAAKSSALHGERRARDRAKRDRPHRGRGGLLKDSPRL
jgi:hypothetical protein